MSERQYEFEELEIASLPGVFCHGRAWVEICRDSWRITSVEMASGATFVPLNMMLPIQHLLSTAIEAQLEADSKFVARVESDQAEEYPVKSDYDEHSTYRAHGGRVVG